MSTMITLPALAYLLVAVFYVITTLSALNNLRVYKIADYLLTLLLAGSILLTGVLFIREIGWLDGFLPEVRDHFHLYVLLLLSTLLHNLTYAVFQEESPGWAWLFLTLGVVGAAIFLDASPFALPDHIIQGSWGAMTRRDVSLLILVLSWIGYVMLSLLYIRRAMLVAEKTVIKHRSEYWGAGLTLFTGGSILLIASRPLFGTLLLLASAVTFDYLVLTYRLPDVRNLLYRASSAILSGTLVLLIFALGYLLFDRFFGGLPWYHPVFNGGLMALFTLLVYSSVSSWVQDIIQDLIGDEFNRQRALREYAKSVSSILDLELLSRVTVEMICDELDVEQGVLFLVDKLDPEKDPPDWRLRAVKGMGMMAPNLEFLPAHTPITHVLAEEKRALTQSELEVIPKYQTVPKKLHNWLNALEAEAYVPIHTQDEWIGLFALSMKTTGGSFTDEDLEFLAAVADQTSVALQNARLVENLTSIDNELRRVEATKNAALDKIERIKRSASDFISIKAHELRSPLTVMSGYTSLLSNDVELMEEAYYEKLIHGIQGGLERLQEIIDSMLETAQVSPRTLNIATEPISLYMVIDQICRNLQQNVQARKITLSHDGLGEIPNIYGDREALNKVFRYLITYAMTHTPSEGKISITGRHIPLRSELLKWEGAEIVIRDTGIGIDADLQQMVFDDLSQPDFVDVSLQEGEGLEEQQPGEQLPVVRGIIEAHNGRMWVETPQKGEKDLPGSEFHVVLPLRQQSHPTQVVE